MKHEALAVREVNAAKMLDLSKQRFSELVACGALPRPVSIAGEKRWRVDDLRAILDGSAARPDSEDITL